MCHCLTANADRSLKLYKVYSNSSISRVSRLFAQTCRVSSCTEWCLSKGGGACHQIYVRVRQNGTDVDFEVRYTPQFRKTDIRQS
jgi:hypothetical protein